MKIAALTVLAALMLVGMGCSNEDATTPRDQGSLSYDVIGDDAPQTVDVAIQELSDLSITVPDPVSNDDPAITVELNMDAALAVVDRAALDEDGRINFRRIVTHLHDQMQLLRQCMSENSDPRLRRLAYGAFHATQHGLRALQAGEPRRALQCFHVANRALNLANHLCRGDGRGGDRP